MLNFYLEKAPTANVNVRLELQKNFPLTGAATVFGVFPGNERVALVTLHEDGSIGRWAILKVTAEKYNLNIDDSGRLRDFWG